MIRCRLMLASLLPALRDLRAPLAAGYLWLFAGWLVLEPHYASWDKSGGPLASTIQLSHQLTPAGLGVAVSFVAYLIGSLSQSAFSGLAGALKPRIWSTAEIPLVEPPWKRVFLSKQVRSWIFLRNWTETRMKQGEVFEA